MDHISAFPRRRRYHDASTSNAKELDVSLTDILSVADWSSVTTFNKFYYRKTYLREAFDVGVSSLALNNEQLVVLMVGAKYARM